MISGLFLAQRDRPRLEDLSGSQGSCISPISTLLWMTIQLAVKAPAFAVSEQGWDGTSSSLYLVSFIDPFGTLWFIYLLPLFFVTVKLARQFRRPSARCFGWSRPRLHDRRRSPPSWIGRSASSPERFVYSSAPATSWRGANLSRSPPWCSADGRLALAGLADLGGCSTVRWWRDRRVGQWPFVSLGLGLVGACRGRGDVGPACQCCIGLACVALLWTELDRHLPRPSSCPWRSSRTALMLLDVFDVGTVSVLVTACGRHQVRSPYGGRRVVLHLDFLYVAPGPVPHRRAKPRVVLQPAE